MNELRFAILGTGFWSRYQLAAWKEIPGARCVALCNRTREKAAQLGREFGITGIYTDAEAMFAAERLDFVDIITDVGTHEQFVKLAAKNKIPVICQKPMAPSLQAARRMMEACEKSEVPLSIHENWRWQKPIQELKKIISSEIVGPIFRARVDYCNSFPVFENQPFLKDLEQFILTDMGSHILDTARFLFGEAGSVYCRTSRVHQEIKGEDVATVMLGMNSGATVNCNISYASPVEHDRFPETFIFIEGEKGSIELAPDYWVRLTTKGETKSWRCPPPFHPWADARYALVHSSIVDCNAALLRALQTKTAAPTSAADNFETMRLVFAAYESSSRGQVITLTK